MRFQLISDVHGQFNKVHWDKKADIILASGDISDNIDKSLSFLLTAPVPVIYIAGNHEFYKGDYLNRNEYIKEQCDKTNNHITYLDRNVAILPNIRILGTTLWSDFNYFDPILVDAAEGLMNDYFYIHAGSIKNNKEWLTQIHKLEAIHNRARRFAYLNGGIDKILIEAQYLIRQKRFNLNVNNKFSIDTYENFSPAISYLLHKQNTFWLDHTLSKPFEGETIVMTHHAPSKMALSLANFSVSPYSFNMEPFLQRKLSPYKIGAYTSSLEGLATKYNINHWVHGHFHNPMLYRMGNSIVHCHPTGNHKDSYLNNYSNSYVFETNDFFKNQSLLNHLNHCLVVANSLLKWFLHNENDFRIIDKLKERKIFSGVWDEFSVPMHILFSIPANELPSGNFLQIGNPLNLILGKEKPYANEIQVKEAIKQCIIKLNNSIDFLESWQKKLV